MPRPRHLLLALAAVATVFGLAGCGASGPAKPSEAALEAKLKTESELQSFSAADIACAAAVVRQYGDASSLQRYVEGQITADQLQGSDRQIVQQKLDACFKH